jgi:CheY-like chemotaxis protein
MTFANSQTSASTPARLTVLLANEQEAWHPTVRQLLAPQGVHLLTAHTGREALSIMESQTVHVAVLDYRMPQLGGLQVIKLVKEWARSRGRWEPATILLADGLTNTLLHEALGMSVFTVLAKPVDHEQLLDALARAMRRYHRSQWPTGAGTEQ